MSRRAQPAGRPARGAALLIAMVLLTVVATLAAGMVWQQWRGVQVEAAERSRSQSYAILSGALDWSRLILREQNKAVVALSDPWAYPLAEARLSSFLAADADNNSDPGLEAFLSGQIVDVQSRYNLRNLIAEGKPVEAEVATLRALVQSAAVGADVADRIVAGLLAATLAASSDAPLPPQQLDDLAWLGIDRDAIDALRPYVTLLDAPTPINVNTASREVIAAVLNIDLGSAERIARQRGTRAWEKLADVQGLLPPTAEPLPASRIAVTSTLFEVTGQLRLEDRVVQERSLVQKTDQGVVVLRRERLASRLVDQRR